MYELLLMKHRTSNTPDFLRALRSQIQVHLLKQIEVQGVSQADKLILKPKRAFILRKKSHEYGFFLWHQTLEVYVFFTSNVTISSNLRITQNLEGKISLEWKRQNGFEKCSWRP